MERKKEILISGSQLAVILCICRLPDILFGLPASGETQIRAVILGEGVRLLTFLPLCAAAAKGWVLPEGKAGAVLRFGAAVVLLSGVCGTLRKLGSFASDTLYPGSPAVFFSAAALLAALYGAHMGLEAAARASLPVLVLIIAGMLLTAVGVREESRLVHLLPAESISAVVSGAVRTGLRPEELLVFLAVGPQSGGKRGNLPAAAAGLGLSATLSAAAAFLSGTVLGGLQGMSAYPFFRVQTLMRLSVFQRMDAWFLALWSAVIFLRCVFLLRSAEELLEPLAGKRRRFLLPVMGAAVLVLLL